MIVYNVTIQVDHDIEKEWLEWMNTVHIPNVMATGCFLEGRISKLLLDDETGITYSIQYVLENMQKLDEYQQKHAAKLQKEHSDRYENKFVAFRTVMEVKGKHLPK
jgi:hypothetical protein